MGWNSPEMLFLQLVILPFSEIGFFWLLVRSTGGSSTELNYVVIGNALQVMCFASIFAVSNVVSEDKYQGTLPSLLISPANRLAVYVGRALYQILISVAMAISGLVMAGLVFGVPFGNANVVTIAAVLLVTSAAMVGFGLLISSIGLYFRTAIIVANVFLFVGVLLCGVNFPVSELPSWLSPVSYCIPLTYGMSALRLGISGGSLPNAAMLLTQEIIDGAALVVVGFTISRAFEHFARRSGRFEAY